MTQHSPNRAITTPFITAAASGCCLLALALIISGCGTDNVTSKDPEIEPPVEIPIESILHNLQPDAFGITVPRSLPRGDLDEWAKSMLADMIDQDVDDQELAAELGQYLQPEQIDRIIRRQFVLQDCTHVRDMLWARDLFQAIHVPRQGNGDLDQIAAVFYHVMHTVHLAAPGDPALPLGPFEIMLHGRGTAADRAWAFAVILQQRRIPAVVIQLPGEAEEPSNAFLVGVLVNSEVYLFDTVLGLAVPGPDDSTDDALIRRPATLVEAIADDGLLRQLDGANPYDMTSELLQEASLQIVGDTSLWSRRMEGLNNALTGSAIVYTPIVGEGGMINLLTSLKNVPAERVGIWKYADQQRQARELLTDEQQARLDAWDAPLQVPYLISVIETPEQPEAPASVVVESDGRQTHRVARVDQIRGQAQKAIPRYLKVQGWRQVPPTTRHHAPIDKDAATIEFVNSSLPENIRKDHAMAAEQARFWRASSQMQLGNWAAAARDFESYITSANVGTDSDGTYRDQAAYLCGIALAQDGRLSRAAAYMRLVPASDPASAAARLLENRWSPKPASE